jgi:hypothetical protein
VTPRLTLPAALTICSMEQSASGETNSHSASQEIIRLFYGTQTFIAVIATALPPPHWPYPESDKSIPHLTTLSLRSILISYSHLRLRLPSGQFFRQTFRMQSLSPHACYMPRPSYPLHLITLIIFRERHMLGSFSLYFAFEMMLRLVHQRTNSTTKLNWLQPHTQKPNGELHRFEYRNPCGETR